VLPDCRSRRNVCPMARRDGSPRRRRLRRRPRRDRRRRVPARGAPPRARPDDRRLPHLHRLLRLRAAVLLRHRVGVLRARCRVHPAFHVHADVRRLRLAISAEVHVMETLRRRPPLPYETAMNKPIADHHPYALDLAAFRDLGRRTVDLAADYLEQLDSRPAVNVVPDDERRLLMGIALPDEGMQAHDMLAFLEQHVMPWPLPASHRRSYGWICSPSAPIAILADTIATTMNTGLDGYDHASLFLMQGLGRWFMELAGFPV